MQRVDKMFPDFHDNKEIHEYGTWGSNVAVRFFRKASLWLNKHKMYFALSVFWGIVKPFAKE